MIGPMQTKKVNIFPARGKAVYSVSPALTGATYNVVLPVNIIRNIIKKDRADVQEVLEDGSVIGLNLDNLEIPGEQIVEEERKKKERQILDNSGEVNELKSQVSKLEAQLKLDNDSYKESLNRYKEDNADLKAEIAQKDKKIKELEELLEIYSKPEIENESEKGSEEPDKESETPETK